MEELEAIVQRMIDAGESEENIAKVIQEFNKSIKKEDETIEKSTEAEQKAGVGLDFQTGPAKKSAVVGPKNVAPEDMDLSSGDGLLDSQELDGEFYIDGNELEYADPKKIIPSNFKLPEPVIIDKNSESINLEGETIKGDPRSSKNQLELYNQRSSNIMNATGEYEFLKTKPLNVRKKVLDRENIPTQFSLKYEDANKGLLNNWYNAIGKRVDKAYSGIREAFGLEEDMPDFKEAEKNMVPILKASPEMQNAVNQATKNFDVTNFDNKKQIADYMDNVGGKLLFKNPLIKQEVENINLANVDFLSNLSTEVTKKYNLKSKPTEENYIKARQEYAEKANKIIGEQLQQSKVYKQVAAGLDIAIGNDILNKNKELIRSKDDFLNSNFIKTLESFDEEDDLVDLTDVAESGYKSVKNLQIAGKELLIALKTGKNQKNQKEYKQLKEEYEVWTKGEKAPWMNRDNPDYVSSTSERDERLAYIVSRTEKLNKIITDEAVDLAKDVNEIENLKEAVGVLFEPEIKEDALFASSATDMFGLIAEQSVNIGLMATGQKLNSNIIKFAAGSAMYTQEFGENYYGGVVANLRDELNREPTDKEIATAITTGRFEDVIIAGLGATLQTVAEYYGTKTNLKAFGGGTGLAKSIVRMKGFKDVMKRAVTTGLLVGENAVVEGTTEGIQEGIKQLVQGINTPDRNPFSRINLTEISAASKAGFNVGIGLSSAGVATSQAKIETFEFGKALALNGFLGETARANYQAAEDFFDKTQLQLDNKFKDQQEDSEGNLPYTREQYIEDSQALSDVRNAGIKLPKEYASGNKEAMFDLLIQKEQLNRRLNKLKETLTNQEIDALYPDFKEQTELINAKMKKIADTEQFTKQSLKFAKSIGLGKDIQAFETQEEALAAVEAWNADPANENNQMSLDEADGAISEDGKTIFLDKQTAAKLNGNVDVAGHEILHRFLIKTLETNSDAAIKIKEGLKQYIEKINPKSLKNTKLKALMDQYDKAPEDMQAEEFMILFTGLMKEGTVQLDETASEKVGNIFRRIFNDLGLRKLKFKDGKDVVNFMKDYNYETQRGRASKVFKTASKKGIEIDENLGKNKKPIKTKGKIKPQSKNSKIINDKNYKTVVNESVDFADKFIAADALIQENKGIIYPKLGIDVSGDLSTAAIDRAMVNQILGESVWQDKEGKTKRRPKGIFESYIPSGKKGGSEVITYLPATLAKRRDEIFREAGFTPESNIFTKLDNPDVKQMADSSTVTSPKIKGVGKARVPAAFEEFTAVTPEFMKEVLNIVKPILNTTSNPDIQAENIIEALDEVAAKEITNLLYDKLGKISTQKDPVSGRIEYIMPQAYTQFFDTQSDLFSRAIPLEDIKKVYTRSTPKLFKVTKIGRENIKNVNKFTGKVTYPGRDIFKIEAAGKGAIGSFFLTNGRNSVTRQNTLFKIIGKGLASPSVYNYLSEPRNVKNITGDPKTQVAIALENEKLLVTAVELDRKAFEDRSFDNFKNSKTIRDLPLDKKAIWFANYSEFIDSVSFYGANDLAVELSMNSIYGDKENGDFTPKQWDNLSDDIKALVKRYEVIKQDFKKAGVKLKTSVDTYVSTEIEGITAKQDLRTVFGLAAKALDFNDYNQLQSYSNSIVALGQHILRKFNGNEQKALSFMVNKIGQALTSMGKTGRAEFIFNNKGQLTINPQYKPGKGLERFKTPFVTKYSNSLRYGIYDTQEKFMKVVLEAMVKNKQDLTIKKSGRGTSIFYKGKALKETKVTQSEAGKKDILKGKLNLDERAKQSKEDGDAFIEVLDWYKDQVNDKNSSITLNDAGMMLMGMNSDMNTIMRTAAGLESIISGKFPSLKSKDWTWEHNIPARVIVIFAADYINNGTTTKENMEQLMKDYSVAMIPKTMDDVIAKFNKDTMVPGYKIGDNTNKRYYNLNTFGKFPFSMKNIRTGKTIPISKNQPIAYKAVEKAKVYNESKFKNSKITFPKNATNEDVLNKMETLDVKAQEARVNSKNSKILNQEFNEIIEKATGIGKEKQYGRTKARAVGAGKGRFDLLGIPPSAQDFVGLTRYFVGKGKQGDKAIAWIKENFLDPFARANIDISNARVALANDFKNLKKILNISPKDLNKKITGEPYTVGGAVRVYTWVQQGMTIPGLSKADQTILVNFIEADPNLTSFANELIAINKENGYPKPSDSWLAGTIKTDLLAGINNVSRPQYLKEWQKNVNEVFSEENLNKLEAAFGSGYRNALENILGRMRTGSNRGALGDSLTGRFVDWLNASVGAIMFFNIRSAVLQTISAVNFVNFTDNNIFKAAKAFANQSQYWKDVMSLMNSDYLIERRNGLKINVNEADIAEIAAESKNKAKAFVNKLLKLGFLPTQIADSFAIASGGATFYRNRVNSLLKEGMSQKEAEAQAFLDFREIAEESQQSSRPDRISKQQAGPLGRIILAFANTPAQYARLMQKAASDLKNRRGDDKTNISKIIYYGAIQNVIFNALQQALFAMAFGDDTDEEKKQEKYVNIVNGMADSLLRGIGFHGAAISTLKNTIMKLSDGVEAQDAAIELLDISPPISSKIGKLRSAGRTWDWNQEEMREKGWSFDNPAWLAMGQVISASTNVPLDRGIRKLQNLRDASDAENEEWMRVANVLGWQKWELEWEKNKDKKETIKSIFKSSTNFKNIKFNKIKFNKIKF